MVSLYRFSSEAEEGLRPAGREEEDGLLRPTGGERGAVIIFGLFCCLDSNKCDAEDTLLFMRGLGG